MKEISTRDRIMALLSPPSQEVHLTVEDARWIKDEIERLNKDVDGLMELLRREKARVEALEASEQAAMDKTDEVRTQLTYANDHVEALEDVYLMAHRYLLDPNWDTHRQNLVNALKKAATEQEGET